LPIHQYIYSLFRLSKINEIKIIPKTIIITLICCGFQKRVSPKNISAFILFIQDKKSSLISKAAKLKIESKCENKLLLQVHETGLLSAKDRFSIPLTFLTTSGAQNLETVFF
jgi:hypothetical protein